jgi:hypothetical protein
MESCSPPSSSTCRCRTTTSCSRWPCRGWQGGCRWPVGGGVAADGQWVAVWLQMASGWRCGCRWPVGGGVAADGQWVAMWPQMADRGPCGRRWPVGGGVAADGRQMAMWPQMASGWRCGCRWPTDAMWPQIALLGRRPRAGLDGAPPQTPRLGPEPSRAHARQDGWDWTASNREGYGLGGPILGPERHRHAAYLLAFRCKLLARQHASPVWI